MPWSDAQVTVSHQVANVQGVLMMVAQSGFGLVRQPTSQRASGQADSLVPDGGWVNGVCLSGVTGQSMRPSSWMLDEHN